MTETDVFERIDALSEDYHNILDAKNREIERLKNCLDKEIKEKESLQRYVNDLLAINQRLSNKLYNSKEVEKTKYVKATR